jgi:hypothetical protein
LFEGLVFHFVYKLERHRLLNMSLRRWLILLSLIVPATMWLQVWKVSRLVAVLVTLGALIVLIGIWWAQRQRYVRFVERDPSAMSGFGSWAGTGRHGAVDRGPVEPPLSPMQKVGVYATGYFEVGGMRQYLVETPADYTTFETREHCVMTQIPHARFLLLGTSRPTEVGWWYTFFQPAMIRAMTSGSLQFGARPRLAVRLEVSVSDNTENQVLFLSFDDEATRSAVLADLKYDAHVD